jgi:hypothetical protein
MKSPLTAHTSATTQAIGINTTAPMINKTANKIINNHSATVLTMFILLAIAAFLDFSKRRYVKHMTSNVITNRIHPVNMVKS